NEAQRSATAAPPTPARDDVEHHRAEHAAETGRDDHPADGYGQSIEHAEIDAAQGEASLDAAVPEQRGVQHGAAGERAEREDLAAQPGRAETDHRPESQM